MLAVTTTAIGFPMPTGNMTSGAANTVPTGLAGADIPPILVTASAGCPVEGKTDWGRLVTVKGVVEPVKLSVVASSRMRPFPPAPPPYEFADPGCADRVPLPAIVGAITRIAPPDPLPPPEVAQLAE